MPLSRRKSMLEDLRKAFSSGKEPDVPPMPPLPPKDDPVDVPVSALRISRYGLVQDVQLTFYKTTDKKFIIGDHYYYVPRCMQASGATDLDPAIRRLKWVFKKEFASNSTAAKQDSFMGVYSIWYKDLRASHDPKTPKTLSQIGGDFWMMKQLQNEPERGGTVMWEHLPQDMAKELNHDWWFMGVLLPDIDTVCTEVAAARSGGRPF